MKKLAGAQLGQLRHKNKHFKTKIASGGRAAAHSEEPRFFGRGFAFSHFSRYNLS